MIERGCSAWLYSDVGSAEVVGRQFERVGEFVGEGQFPAEQVDFGGSRAPVGLVQKPNSFGFEFVFVV